MGLFRSLLGLKSPASKDSDEQDSTYAFASSSNMVEIPRLGFMGFSSTSPNRRYMIAWSDADLGRGVAGYRHKGHGRYVLLEGGRVILQGNLERPNDGKVANNGTFILNDWLFSDGLNGVFYAIASDGRILMKRRLEANLLNNGLSTDGRYAVCQTCNADSDDGNMLFLFDLETGGTRWARTPVGGWAHHYEFDTAEAVLTVVMDDGFKYRYDFDGKFLDQEKFKRDRVLRAKSGYDFYDLASERLGELKQDSAPPEAFDEPIAFLKKAIGLGNVTPRTAASMHRLLGECYLAQSRIDLAIRHLRQAIEIDPKCGCRRLLSKLLKETQTSSEQG